MSQQSCSKPQTDRVRLASYLTVGVAGAMMATAHSEAAVVNINVASLPGSGAGITGANAGVTSGNKRTIVDWLGAGTGTLELYNNYNGGGGTYWGLDGDNGLEFAVNGTYASPRNFGAGATIDGSATWTGAVDYTSFRYSGPFGNISPDFGAGSFMGFRFGSAGNYNYGYLEVTWNSTTNTFQILSGAFESTVNAAITTPAAIPGAGLSAMALMALGGGAFRRRSRSRVA